MRELPFSIPLSGVIRVDENLFTIIVSRAETVISLETGAAPGKRISLEDGMTMHDVILESAQEAVRRKGVNRFSTADLLAIAREKYPGLKRASFTSRVVAATPDHGSFKHHKSTRDYFSHIGSGMFELNERYMPEKTSDQDILGNQRRISTGQ